MKKLLSILFLSLISITACQRSTGPAQPNPPVSITQNEQQLADANNLFAIKLFKEINILDTTANLFISPLSVSIALGMADNGAATTTRTAFQQVLEQNGMAISDINSSYLGLITKLPVLDPAVQFNIANSIWYRQGYSFESSFFDVCQKYYNSSVTGLDFNSPASVNTINDWVSAKTNGKIPTIIYNIDPSTVMFIINALYFKAAWSIEFDTKLTQDADFYQTPQSPVSCKMMNKEDSLMAYQNTDFQVVQLPYGNKAYSMLLFLPKQGSIDNFIASLTDATWKLCLDSLSRNYVILHLPKFKFDYKISLINTLKALGMSVVFDPNTADFSNMCTANKLYIGDVIHKTYIDVSEVGTEAAAVTSVGMKGNAMPQGFYMIINKPFMFAIYDKYTNSIEFMGKVSAPVYN